MGWLFASSSGPVPPKNVNVPLKLFTDVSSMNDCAQPRAPFEGVGAVGVAWCMFDKLAAVLVALAELPICAAAVLECALHDQGAARAVAAIGQRGAHVLEARLVDRMCVFSTAVSVS